MTMLSAQPLNLTGEQHDRLWGEARAIRGSSVDLDEIMEDSPDFDFLAAKAALRSVAETLAASADRIEHTLIDAQDSAPSTGEAA